MRNRIEYFFFSKNIFFQKIFLAILLCFALEICGINLYSIFYDYGYGNSDQIYWFAFNSATLFFLLILALIACRPNDFFLYYQSKSLNNTCLVLIGIQICIVFLVSFYYQGLPIYLLLIGNVDISFLNEQQKYLPKGILGILVSLNIASIQIGFLLKNNKLKFALILIAIASSLLFAKRQILLFYIFTIFFYLRSRRNIQFIAGAVFFLIIFGLLNDLRSSNEFNMSSFINVPFSYLSQAGVNSSFEIDDNSFISQCTVLSYLSTGCEEMRFLSPIPESPSLISSKFAAFYPVGQILYSLIFLLFLILAKKSRGIALSFPLLFYTVLLTPIYQGLMSPVFFWIPVLTTLITYQFFIINK